MVTFDFFSSSLYAHCSAVFGAVPRGSASNHHPYNRLACDLIELNRSNQLLIRLSPFSMKHKSKEAINNWDEEKKNERHTPTIMHASNNFTKYGLTWRSHWLGTCIGHILQHWCAICMLCISLGILQCKLYINWADQLYGIKYELYVLLQK